MRRRRVRTEERRFFSFGFSGELGGGVIWILFYGIIARGFRIKRSYSF